jgi:ArsR family transcriptional regulator, arsenate/arsenite/antimonite-responsive transcriptional repressor
MRTDHVKHLPPRWEAHAQVFRALGDPMRQKILLLFERRERLTIKQIANVFGGSRTNIVHHIRVLEDASVLRREKVGKDVQLWIDKRHLMSSIRKVANFVWMRT